MITDALYTQAEENGITVLCGADLPLTKSVSLYIDGEYFIGIDDSAMRTRAEERVHLAHELGHCMTGAFYNMYSPIDSRTKHERKATEYAIQKLIPKKQLDAVIQQRCGDIGAWELAEIFDVTEDFMRKAISYYYDD